MTSTSVRRLALSAVIVLLGAATAQAQMMRPRADVSPLAEQPVVQAGSSTRIALRVVLPDTLHVQSDQPRDPALIPTRLTIGAPAGVTVDEIVYPPSSDLEQVGQDQPLAVFDHEFLIGVQLRLDADVSAGALIIPARLRYQACDDKLCYLPSTAEAAWTIDVVPPGTTVPPPDAAVFAGVAFGSGRPPTSAELAAPWEALPASEPASARRAPDGARLDAPTDSTGLGSLDRFAMRGTTGGYLASADFLQFIDDAEKGVEARGLFEGRGPLAILAIVFLGGLALNLTPCVLPMIPINLAIIGAGAAAGSRGRGFLLGSTYGAAMAIVYGAIGLAVILTAGTFGTINASPWFNLAIAVIFVVLGLAMFDLLHIDFSRLMPVGGPMGASRGTFAVAFGMGAVAALLAGACVAPVVIQVVLFASNLYASGNQTALALPFVLGLGMALPWPIAGAGVAALPRPGMWMVRVKQAFGVVILATAAYYGYLAYTLFANRWVDPAAVQASMQAKLDDGWHASLADGLAEAEREGRPVLVDLWATWCKNCLTMDSTTFTDPAVVAALDDYVKIKVQAEDPDDPATREVMQRFGAVGLPTYAVLQPKDEAR